MNKVVCFIRTPFKKEFVVPTLKVRGSKTIFTISEIMSLFLLEKEEIGIREVSRILGLNRSNIHRLLSVLEKCGFLEKDSRNKYRIGEKIFGIGSLYSYHFPLIHLNGLMRRIVWKLGEY